VAAVDFRGDGHPVVVAGSTGATVTALSARGEKLWTFEAPYYKRAAHVHVVFPARLDGDARETAIVGADNWHFYALDAAGKPRWAYESVHASTCGAAGDVNGDGRDEVVAGTEYYWWHVIRPDGKPLFTYSTRGGPHANAAAVANLDGGKQRCPIFGGADGNVHALNPDGSVRWLFNAGDEITGLAALDVNADGKDEVVATSMNDSVYALDGGGKPLWRRNLQSKLTSVVAFSSAAGPRVLVGCRDGAVYLLDARTGEVLAGLHLEGAVLKLAVARQAGGGTAAAVTTEDGSLHMLAVG
jgi:outer membrane protein assembly factor BamB